MTAREYLNELNRKQNEAENDKSAQGEKRSNQLGRRRSLAYRATLEGVGSADLLSSLTENLIYDWALPDNKVKTFKETVSVVWHDAQDLNDSVNQQLSRRWSDIHSKIIKGCSSVKKLQRELNMVTTDDIDGSYDDYIVDATSLSGMSKKSNVASKSSHRHESELGIQNSLYFKLKS